MKNEGCGYLLIVFLVATLFFLVPIAKRIGPTIDNKGFLTWDFTGFIAQQENETERERIKQQEETERAGEWNETLRTVAMYGAFAGVVIVWAIQHNRTKRKAIDAWALLDAARPSMPPQQIANIYINTFLPNGGRVVNVNGIPMIADAEQRRLIPLDVAAQRLTEARLLPGPIDPPP
jgi:hypothetical protein